jgi:hypothetical protein
MGKRAKTYNYNKSHYLCYTLKWEKICHPAPFLTLSFASLNGAGPNSSENFLESTIAKVLSRLHTYSYKKVA